MLLEPRARIGRHLAVERDVAALGRDHHLIARDLARRDQLANRLADIPLAALEAVVHRRVDQIDAAAQAGLDRFLIFAIGLVVGFAQVRADSNRRNRHARAPAGNFPAAIGNRLAYAAVASAVARPLSIMLFLP